VRQQILIWIEAHDPVFKKINENGNVEKVCKKLSFDTGRIYRWLGGEIGIDDSDYVKIKNCLDSSPFLF
jgi:hypothetical protein